MINFFLELSLTSTSLCHNIASWLVFKAESLCTEHLPMGAGKLLGTDHPKAPAGSKVLRAHGRWLAPKQYPACVQEWVQPGGFPSHPSRFGYRTFMTPNHLPAGQGVERTRGFIDRKLWAWTQLCVTPGILLNFSKPHFLICKLTAALQGCFKKHKECGKFLAQRGFSTLLDYQ